MGRRLSSVITVCALGATLGALPSGAAHAATASSTATSASTVPARTTLMATTDFETRLLSLVNARRKKIGCRTLATNTALVRAARSHSRLMAAAGNLSHQLPREAGLATRIVSAGYTRWTGLAENIAWGASTPGYVFSLWMNSSGHRTNIQHCSYRDAGVGVVYKNGRPWVTLDLGSHR